jgi:hypothetical protein
MLTLGITASSLITSLTRVFTNSQNFTLPSGYSKMSVYILGDGAGASANYLYNDPNDENGDGNFENTGQTEKYGGAGGGLRYSLNKAYTAGQSMNITKNSGDFGFNQVIVNGTSYLMMRNATGSVPTSQGTGDGGDGVIYGGYGGYAGEGDFRPGYGGGAAGTSGAGGSADVNTGVGTRGAGISFKDSVSGVTYTNGAGGQQYGGGGTGRGYGDTDSGFPGFIAVVFS